MLIASVSSNKYKSIEDINDISIIGAFIILGFGFFPILIVEFLIELYTGDIPFFDLNFIFLLNVLTFHLILKYFFDIKIKFFFVPTYYLLPLVMIYHWSVEHEIILTSLGLG